ncbi:hypothetical protein HDV06_002196, partial [Boothiomyces sp. JEL0866]
LGYTFVGIRAVHSYIQCFYNTPRNLYYRFRLLMASTGVLAAMFGLVKYKLFCQ